MYIYIYTHIYNCVYMYIHMLTSVPTQLSDASPRFEALHFEVRGADHTEVPPPAAAKPTEGII